jgi:hypothetical protein
MPTQILPAASLRSANRLPAARTLLRVANYLIRIALWSIGRAIVRVAANFLPVSQGEAGSSAPAPLPAMAPPRRIRVRTPTIPARELTTKPIHPSDSTGSMQRRSRWPPPAVD